jgi:hypothetical protein
VLGSSGCAWGAPGGVVGWRRAPCGRGLIGLPDYPSDVHTLTGCGAAVTLPPLVRRAA